MLFVRLARVLAPHFKGRAIVPASAARRLLALVGLLMAAACATAPGLPGLPGGNPGLDYGSEADQKIGRPYQVGGVWYVPAREDDYDETGIASWYGPGFHNRSTSNGEIFDENLISAAHTTLPIPSLVEVQNLENGRRIVARLNDRGPFVDDRIIDMSRAAARELGFERQGTARVRVRYLGPAPVDARAARGSAAPEAMVARREEELEFRPPARQRGGDLYVQVASFSERDRAQALVRQLGSNSGASIERARVEGRTYHRVMVGPWRDQSGAQDARRQVAGLGYRDARIVEGR
jgi:rare lipoprotein A